jgi:hypothetical protein
MENAMTVLDWLLDSDPAIRWQVLRDLTDAQTEEVGAERERVAQEGWGAELLAAQGADGQWSGGALFPEWRSTTYTLQLLRQFGVDPTSEKVQHAIARVRANSRWEHDDEPYFEGEVEPCINGRLVSLGAYFGVDVRGVVNRLLTEQMDDDGWNCEQEKGSTRGSFDTTINVLEGLLDFERFAGDHAEVSAARKRGEEYLLKRRMFRRLSTGAVITPRKGGSDWLQFSFPYGWRYGVLRGLDYLRGAGVTPDERIAEAIGVVKSKRDADGRWPLDHAHHDSLLVDFDEREGKPSRWITLHALRVLRWAGQED